MDDTNWNKIQTHLQIWNHCITPGLLRWILGDYLHTLDDHWSVLIFDIVVVLLMSADTYGHVDFDIITIWTVLDFCQSHIDQFMINLSSSICWYIDMFVIFISSSICWYIDMFVIFLSNSICCHIDKFVISLSLSSPIWVYVKSVLWQLTLLSPSLAPFDDSLLFHPNVWYA